MLKLKLIKETAANLIYVIDAQLYYILTKILKPDIYIQNNSFDMARTYLIVDKIKKGKNKSNRIV